VFYVLQLRAIAGGCRLPKNFWLKGGWNLISLQFAESAPVSSWTFLQIHFHDDGDVIDFEDLKWNADQFERRCPITA
jgi:hypothetical protein